jgi:hypothetical protein
VLGVLFEAEMGFLEGRTDSGNLMNDELRRGLPASFLRLDFAGQGETKTCAAWRVAGSPQAASMRLDDGAADSKSQAGAVTLGGKECIKDLVRVLLRQSHAGIAHRDQELLVFGSVRFDDEIPRPIHILHRVNAVHDEVHHYLLQLHVISHGPGKIRCQFRVD